MRSSRYSSKGVKITDRPLDTVGHHHGPGLAADLKARNDLIVKVIDHDLRLLADGVLVRFDISSKLPLCSSGVKQRIVLHRLHEPAVAVHRGVVLQHIQDEALLYRLFHRVAVEWNVPDLPALGYGLSENLQRLVLRRCGKREVAGVGQQSFGLHQPVDLVLGRLVFVPGTGRPQGHGDRGGRPAALARMGFVDDDGEPAASVFIADLVENERELLDRRDDDLLAGLQERSQVTRPLRMADDGFHLGELPDRVTDLPVEHQPVGDNDDGVESRFAACFQFDHLVGEPGNRVALARSRRMLDQVALACAGSLHVRQQLANHVELVETREDLLRGLLPAFVVPLLDHLGVVFEDVRQVPPGQNLLPEVAGLEAGGIRRIAPTVVPTLVEGQEPRSLTFEVGAHPHLVIVHREMDGAAAEPEKQLPRVAVALVLLDGVLDGLLRQAVLELERSDRQAVDEERHVERQPGFVLRVVQLARDAEDVRGEQLLRLGVAGRRRAKE